MSLEKDKLQQELTIAFDDFITTFSAFDEEQVNDKADPTRWSAVQVALHIINATDGVPDTQTQSLAK